MALRNQPPPQAEPRQQLQQLQANSYNQQQDPKQLHKLVSKRYKELRQEGHTVKDAMAMARAENGLVEEEEPPSLVGAKVASMFGVQL